MDRNSIVKALALLLTVSAIFIAITWALVCFADVGITDSARAVQALGTIIAISAGGLFAIFKLQMFRDFQPHLTISHVVLHRPVGESYVHIDVAVTLHNSSKVKIELRDGFFRLQQIAPVIDEDVETLYPEVFVDKTAEDIQWPTLDEIPLTWDKGVLIVEPSEAHQETFEFIVSKAVESVIIHTYFYNPYSSSPEGWGATTVYDIIESS